MLRVWYNTCYNPLVCRGSYSLAHTLRVYDYTNGVGIKFCSVHIHRFPKTSTVNRQRPDTPLFFCGSKNLYLTACVWVSDGHNFSNKMKKLFFSLVLCTMSMATFAQKEVTVKAGTLVPLQVVNPTQAADVKKGQKVAFRVSRDISVNGVTAIPYGTTANGTVYEARKSSWWGTKGRLGIKINELIAPNGEVMPLTNGDVYVTGKNRTTLSVALFCLVVWPACFICGSKAELPAGYEVQANVAADTSIKVN